MVKKGLFFALGFYHRRISPLLPRRCRYYPTCSDYAKRCLEQYPLKVALIKICCRLSKCHPLSPGGVDLP